MRTGITTEVLNALEAAGITTALMARLDFESETVCVWTGASELTIHGSADTVLNDQTFYPLAHGIIVEIGDNSFSYSGSEALEVALGIPASPSLAIEAALVNPSEYQSRSATIWRALLIKDEWSLAEPVWTFRRIRSGIMDLIEFSGDGQSRTFKLTIEGHAANISQATNSSYLDQPKFDPSDYSQQWAPTLANGGEAPSKASSAGWVGAVSPAQRQSDWFSE
jgi:hypothetical protein